MKQKWMFFWNSLPFSMIQWMLAIWFLIPLPFLNPFHTSGSSWFIYYWSLTWRILSITLLAWEMSEIAQSFGHSLSLSFFGIGVKTKLVQFCGHCWVFQICWHIECNALTAPSFRIWISSGGISSSPLALFIVMLPKAHLSLHSRTFDSRWVTTLSWLTKSLRLFLYSSSVYSCYLFLISSAPVRFLLFLTFIVPILRWNVPLVSLIFLRRSLFFPILLLSFISLYCSLSKAFLSFLTLLRNSEFSWISFPLSLAFHFFSFLQLFVKPPKTTILPSWISFPWDGFGHSLLCNVTNLYL